VYRWIRIKLNTFCLLKNKEHKWIHDDYGGMVVLVAAAAEVVVVEEGDTFLQSLSLQLNFCYN